MKSTILIADDSPLIRDIVGSIITSMGHTLLTAEDGISGVRKAFSYIPDLIILDISMPGINGFQACRLLKNDPVTAHIPIIILTGEKRPISQFWGKEVGADSYIVKSKDIGPLSKEIAKLLEERKIKTDAPSVEEEISEMKILGKISQLLDKELIKSTLRKIELESILQNINEAIIVIDRTDLIKEINDYGLDLFDLRSQAWQNLKIQHLIPEREFLTFDTLIAQSNSGLIKEREITYTSRSKTHNLLIDFSLIKNFQSDIEAIVIFFRDITHLKEFERMKAEYFYNVVQEIRNPLTSAKEAIHFLLSDTPGKMNETQNSVLKIIQEDVNRLIRFTDSMINISEMELSSSLLNLERLDAVRVAQAGFDKNRKMSELKKIKVSWQLPEEKLWIKGDREKLVEVFSNIFSNSVKFNRTGGTVKVAVRRMKKDNKDFVKVAVRDTGVGIDPSELRLIFDKEKKVDARLRKKGGEFGLSMAIAKMVLDLHQSLINVKSNVGKGTTFIVCIPLEQ
ncbi:MAG: response regulator [Candidatus Aureabacteria bacterium]|nr:response regulator [Candidatus Auribacterota bacterium]